LETSRAVCVGGEHAVGGVGAFESVCPVRYQSRRSGAGFALTVKVFARFTAKPNNYKCCNETPVTKNWGFDRTGRACGILNHKDARAQSWGTEKEISFSEEFWEESSRLCYHLAFCLPVFPRRATNTFTIWHPASPLTPAHLHP
jgi:hypothetical protein